MKAPATLFTANGTKQAKQAIFDTIDSLPADCRQAFARAVQSAALSDRYKSEIKPEFLERMGVLAGDNPALAETLQTAADAALRHLGLIHESTQKDFARDEALNNRAQGRSGGELTAMAAGAKVVDAVAAAERAPSTGSPLLKVSKNLRTI